MHLFDVDSRVRALPGTVLTRSTPADASGGQVDLPRCQLCDGAARQFMVRNGFQILRCDSCSFMFAQLPSAIDVNALYTDEAYWNGSAEYGCEYEKYWDLVGHAYLVRLKRIRVLVRPLAPKLPRMLEIGSAAGYFLKAASAAGWDAVGVEIGDSMRKRAAALTGRPVYASIEEAAPGGKRFDCIAMFEVIEHLTEPLTMLKRLRELLVPGGILALTTPNFDCNLARERPKEFVSFSPPAHLCFFGQRTLHSVLEKAGFRAVLTLGSYASQPTDRIPIPGPIAGMLRPLRRGKRLRPHGLLGRILRFYLRRRVVDLRRHPEDARWAETLEIYARRM